MRVPRSQRVSTQSPLRTKSSNWSLSRYSTIYPSGVGGIDVSTAFPTGPKRTGRRFRNPFATRGKVGRASPSQRTDTQSSIKQRTARARPTANSALIRPDLCQKLCRKTAFWSASGNLENIATSLGVLIMRATPGECSRPGARSELGSWAIGRVMLGHGFEMTKVMWFASIGIVPIRGHEGHDALSPIAKCDLRW
jgi:hypothetical protein